MDDHTLQRLGMRGHDARRGHWISGRHARGCWLVSWSGEAWEVWYGLDARIYRTTHETKREACWAVHTRTERMIADEPQWEDERR